MSMDIRRGLSQTILAGTLVVAGGCDRAHKSGGQSVDNAHVQVYSAIGPAQAHYKLSAQRLDNAGGSNRIAAEIGGATLSLSAYAAESGRFVATKHSLEMIASEVNLQKSWQAIIDYCGTIPCEVLSSSITAKTDQALPSGRIALRVEPRELKKLLSFVESQGRVAEHSTESEDKTGQVLDTEAKIKNLTTFRDSLGAMLSRPSVTVKDAIDIQEQLSNVQSQLDSETAGRKTLANETEKVAVDVSFRVEVSASGRGGFRQIWNALRDSGSILAESTAWLIMAVMTLLPWTIVVAMLLWILVRWIRRRKGLAEVKP